MVPITNKRQKLVSLDIDKQDLVWILPNPGQGESEKPPMKSKKATKKPSKKTKDSQEESEQQQSEGIETSNIEVIEESKGVPDPEPVTDPNNFQRPTIGTLDPTPLILPEIESGSNKENKNEEEELQSYVASLCKYMGGQPETLQQYKIISREMEEKIMAEGQKMKPRKIKTVELGKYEMDTWYFSPVPTSTTEIEVIKLHLIKFLN